MEKNKIHHLDFLSNDLPDKCANLIIADPPYYMVKGDFDFIWNSFDEYLEDVEKWAMECKRILADNGTLLWWGHALKIAYSQVILDKYFNLENALVWYKTDCQTRKGRETFRKFAPVTERVLMYSNEVLMTGLEAIMEQHIRPNHPFANYLRSEFERAGVTNREIAKLFPSKTGGLTGCVSNWLTGANVITKEQYKTIRDYLNGEYLRQEYEELRQEYEELRRPFQNFKHDDVLFFAQDVHISGEYDHDTVKPEALTKDLIEITTRPDSFVVVPFAGSGTECACAAKLGREFIGFDIEEKHVNTANERVNKILHWDKSRTEAEIKAAGGQKSIFDI